MREIDFPRLSSEDVAESIADKIEASKKLPIRYQLLANSTPDEELTHDSFNLAYHTDSKNLFGKMRDLIIADAASKAQLTDILSLFEQQRAKAQTLLGKARSQDLRIQELVQERDALQRVLLELSRANNQPKEEAPTSKSEESSNRGEDATIALGKSWLEKLRDDSKYLNESYVAHILVPQSRIVMITSHRFLIFSITKPSNPLHFPFGTFSYLTMDVVLPTLTGSEIGAESFHIHQEIPYHSIKGVTKLEGGIGLTFRGDKSYLFPIKSQEHRDYFWEKLQAPIRTYSSRLARKKEGERMES